MQVPMTTPLSVPGSASNHGADAAGDGGADPRLAAYLARIGFTGTPRVDLDTLARIQHGHMRTIPYENLDVQLGRTVGFDLDAQLDKLVARPRGGWCYEMNGVLGWALGQLGFRVTRLAGAVARQQLGDSQVGNHLVLRVDLEGQADPAHDGPWLVDVGFGDCPLWPVRWRAHAFVQGFLDMRLEPLDGHWWRLHSHARGAAPSFDVSLDPALADRLVPMCSRLQTDPGSPFVQNVVCMRHHEDHLLQLRGKVLTTLYAHDTRRRELADADDLLLTLREQFGIDEPAAATLWPRIEARHRELLLARR
jgi:N-hydroxyarylamine O-acetyltransferase